MSTQWIVIPNWKKFQHYTNRDITWIKNHLSITADDDYLALSFHARGVLHGLWIEYARSNGKLPADTPTLSRRLGQKVTTPTLTSLNHAGLIHFSASKPLALTRVRERGGARGGERKEEEVEEDARKREQQEHRPNTAAYQPHKPNQPIGETVDPEIGLELAKRLAGRQRPGP